jgi:hypothetical protein
MPRVASDDQGTAPGFGAVAVSLARDNIVYVADVMPEGLEAAIRAAWARDTCDPVDADDWSAANPSRGQCGSTALTIHDLLGGELLIAEVLHSDGSRQGVHYWNLLRDGTEIDLTREQFINSEVIQQPRVLPRPAGLPKRCAEQYLTMRHRVLTALGDTQE